MSSPTASTTSRRCCGGSRATAGCIDTLARCDEVKRPIPENRIPLRAGGSLAALLREEPALSEEIAPAKARAALPKGRNFR